MDNKPATIIGLDVGTVRIGVSIARLDVRIVQPLTTLYHNEDIFEQISTLALQSEASEIIVGWPRGMDGQETQQTRDTEQFADQLRLRSGLTVRLQDEALTSQKAETELQARRKPYSKADVDALAATYILEDYLHV